MTHDPDNETRGAGGAAGLGVSSFRSRIDNPKVAPKPPAKQAILGILAALEIRTSLVTPQTWKKYFRLDGDKEKGRALALRMFAKTPEHFARKRDHGKGEAALLALYGALAEGGAR